jgi:hypothetical protein
MKVNQNVNLKKYVTTGGSDVQLICCDMYAFHFNTVYFCIIYIWK